MGIFFTWRILWNRISDSVPIVFHFGTENWEEQLIKHPVVSCGIINDSMEFDHLHRPLLPLMELLDNYTSSYHRGY